jgi:muramoyltetrapeptide carboxypeptidase
VKKIEPLVPQPLLPGDRVSIIAPASPFDRDKFQSGLSVIEKMGFRPVFNDDLFQSDGYLAGSDQHRADMFNAAFTDDETTGVWCVRGGYGALRILPLIDYEKIKSCPKVLIGCSDISAIMHALHANCNMITFHGPMIGSLGHASVSTLDALTDMFQWRDGYAVEPESAIAIRSGSAFGPVVGGNLTTLCHLLGTPWHPRFSGSLLFLEDRGEAPYRIDRMLCQMKMAGCFEGLTGLMLGSFEECGPYDRICGIVTDVFSDMDIPMLAGFPAGHSEPNIILPLGVEARLDAHAGTLTYLESSVSQPL